VVFSKLAFGILLISDKLAANSNIEAAPYSLFSKLLVSIFKLRRLLLSTVSLLGLDSVLLKKLSLTEIEKEYDGISDTMVNEKRIMMITIDPNDSLKLKYTFLTGSCLLAILLTLNLIILVILEFSDSRSINQYYRNN
jgi:hypothetical protein